MKPLTFEALVDFRRFPRQMLLLDNSKVTLPYIRRVLARGCNNIRTKCGLSLPPELWDMILNFASIGGSFCLVEAQELHVTTCATGTLLRCVTKELVNYLGLNLGLNHELGALCRFLGAEEDIEALEACLRDPANVEGDVWIEKILPPNDGTFYFFLDSNRPEESNFLYYEIDVPDVISRIEGGECEFCDTTRFICPSDTCRDHGDLREMEVKFLLSSSSCVDIACPVCMGVDFSQEHLFDLVRNGPQEDASPLDLEKQIFDRICDRLRELGYKADMKQEGMLRAIRRPPPELLDSDYSD